MPSCLKCGAPLAVNEEGVAPVLCDRCAGIATGKARRSLALSGAPVTVLLIAISVLAFVLDFIPGFNLKNWGVNYGPLTLSGQYWRLFTAGFLHADILHIGLNMWCLWSVGRLAERIFGKWQTLAVYMVTGVGGALLSIANKPEHGELGASGAIFGIVGAVIAGVKFGDLRISAGEKRAIFSSAISFAVINFMLGTSNIGMFSNVDNMCHLGGFVTGLLVGLPLGAFARRHQLLQLATVVITSLVLFVAARELVQTHSVAILRFRALIAERQHDFPTAVRYTQEYLKDNPQDADAWIDLGKYYVLMDQTESAIKAFQTALKLNPDSDLAKDALQSLGASPQPNTK
jgi:membrane associated rhomboid family serine protease